VADVACTEIDGVRVYWRDDGEELASGGIAFRTGVAETWWLSPR
jgi:hypothetical protein